MILLSIGSGLPQEGNSSSSDDEASELWADAYTWMQTGRNLSKAKQWPLALGSYIEALQKFKEVAKTFPEFEPAMVSFRLEALETDMEDVQKNLASDDHDVMMAYLDFIESMEKGQELRYANNFEAALPTLKFAMSLLENVIANRPEEFRSAVSGQYVRLEDSIDWIQSQQDRKLRNRPMVVAVDTGNLGTTKFVKQTDMPGDPMISVSNLLFPGGPNLENTPTTAPIIPPTPSEKPSSPPEVNLKESLMKRLPKSLGPSKPEPKASVQAKEKTAATSDSTE